jgi:dTDP-4-amino-4,6-dideoxygalactose transaminase
VQIPFLDLKTPHLQLEKELIDVFLECLRNASFVGGPQVQAFEEEFAQFCETKYCVAVNSGTDALRFALIAAEIGPDDEVITVPNTFIATTEAISQTGATPAFVDVDERTYNMDPNKLEDYLKRKFSSSTALLKSGISTKRPKALLPVDLYGQPADMDSILEIADHYGLIVIEDACQAHGALYNSRKEKKWRKAGSMGLAAAFSFYPGKNLGACGEGGAVTTNDEKIAKKIRMLRDHGQAKKYHHEFEGYNGRLDAIQTGILRVKLKHLPEWNEQRRHNASLYTKHLTLNTRQLDTAAPQYCSTEAVGTQHSKLDTQHLTLNTVIVPYEPQWSKAVYHLYVIRTKKRDELQNFLADNGIGTGLHYPIPLHLQGAYQRAGWTRGIYPVTEKVAKEILSLPMYPQLREQQILYVTDKIKEFFSKCVC